MSDWNKPSPKKKPEPKKSAVAALLKVALAGFVIVLVLGAVYFFMFGNEPKVEVKKTTKTHRIKEVTPAPAPARTNAAPTEKKELTPDEKRLARIAEIKAKWGDNPPPGLRTRLYYLEHPPRIHLGQKNPFAFFRHPAERQLAAIAVVMPGEEMIEPMEFRPSFDQEFINCMLDSIEDSQDDTEKDRALKQSVRDMKKELMQVCKAEGKKPSEVMNEYAKTLYELGRYAQTLDEAVSKMRNDPSVSDADVQDLVRAANVLREKKGLDSMPIPSLKGRARNLKYKMELEAKRAANKAAKAAEAAEKAKEEAK